MRCNRWTLRNSLSEDKNQAFYTIKIYINNIRSQNTKIITLSFMVRLITIFSQFYVERTMPRTRVPSNSSTHSSNFPAHKLSLQDSCLCTNTIPRSANTSNTELTGDSMINDIQGYTRNSQQDIDLELLTAGERKPSLDNDASLWTKTWKDLSEKTENILEYCKVQQRQVDAIVNLASEVTAQMIRVYSVSCFLNRTTQIGQTWRNHLM